MSGEEASRSGCGCLSTHARYGFGGLQQPHGRFRGHRIGRAHQSKLCTALLERLVFEVPFVIANLCVEVFSNSVEALVDQHDARHQPNGDSRS